MNKILLSPEVSLGLFIGVALLILLSVASYYAIYILLKYQKNTTTALQYLLEKKSFLLSAIIKIALYVYIFLFAFFAFTIDKLSDLIPGAMCGAGVVSSGSYGTYLIALKFFIIVLSLFWLSLDREDQHAKEYPYFRKKMFFYLFIYTLICIAYFLEINFFLSLSMEEPVLCCSSIYNSSKEIPFWNLNNIEIVSLFYSLYLLIIVSTYFKKRFVLFLGAVSFVYIAYFAIVYFFSTYIYELPTHKCPYCILSFEYYYIGYFIYGSLIMATYYALYGVIFYFKDSLQKKIIFAYTFFTFLVSFKYIYYYLVNGTFL